MEQRNIFISTRFYPEDGDWANVRELPLIEGLVLDKSDINNDPKYIKRNDYPQDNNPIKYSIFVIPCTDYNSCLLKKRLEYLEKVIFSIFPDLNSLDNTFLVAHDRDFNVYGDDVFLSKIPEESDLSLFPALNLLMKKKHIYLFQHEGKIQRILNSIPATDDDKFLIEDCDSLYEFVSGKHKMIQFFLEVDVNNNYPEINKDE